MLMPDKRAQTPLLDNPFQELQDELGDPAPARPGR